MRTETILAALNEDRLALLGLADLAEEEGDAPLSSAYRAVYHSGLTPVPANKIPSSFPGVAWQFGCSCDRDAVLNNKRCHHPYPQFQHHRAKHVVGMDLYWALGRQGGGRRFDYDGKNYLVYESTAEAYAALAHAVLEGK